MPTERLATVCARCDQDKTCGAAEPRDCAAVGAAASSVRLTIRPVRGRGPDLAAAARYDRRSLGSAAVRQVRHQQPARASAPRRARLGSRAPRAQAQAHDAVDPVGGVHCRRARRVPALALLRALPRLGGPPVGHDAAPPPARPRKPRDKAKVEQAVLVVERWLLGRPRHRTFHSLAEVNAAIGELLSIPPLRAALFDERDRCRS
ncbi:hypothetical protein ACVIHI_000060 [Bradyrhizobium sp. USDA 4524]